MKKIIAIILCTLSLLLCACGTDANNEAAAEEAKAFLSSQLETFKNASKTDVDEVLEGSMENLNGVDVSLYYKHLDYEIGKCSATDNTAKIEINIKNLDFGTLMEDYYEELVPYMLSSYYEPEKPGEIFAELVNSGNYKILENNAVIELTKKDGKWSVNDPEAFAIALMPGVDPIF
ncbi:MAG: hypothetical protein E7635_03630 [Ruminococcaceae bacterium]|nr:hypothetical protein [Oscillospiraceae bacterium]